MRPVNVVRRSGVYHFGRTIPAGQRPRLKRWELVRSLKATEARAAKLRADLLYRASESLSEAAASMLSGTVLAHLVQDFYALGLEVDDHARLLGTPPDEELQQFRNQFLAEQISAKPAALGGAPFRRPISTRQSC